MRRSTLLLAAVVAIAGGAYADSELVIAIRYLQAKGTSHSHLYLYREDGKLLRDVNVSARSDVGVDHVAPKLGVRAEFDCHSERSEEARIKFGQLPTNKDKLRCFASLNMTSLSMS